MIMISDGGGLLSLAIQLTLCEAMPIALIGI